MIQKSTRKGKNTEKKRLIILTKADQINVKSTCQIK